MNYCVYVTFYKGNKLPPFYIGSTNIKRIQNGYRGSVSSKDYKEIWKNELKNNPHLFKTAIVSKFNTRQDAYEYENYIHKKMNVVSNPLYINKWYAIPNDNFTKVSGKYNPMYGRKHSLTTKLKISNKLSGRKLGKEHYVKLCENRDKNKQLNSWSQIKNNFEFKKFLNYDDFKNQVIALYEDCLKIPSLIAWKLQVPEKPVQTCLLHYGLVIHKDQKLSKLIKNYGFRWKSYEEYENEIISFYSSGIKTAYKISSQMKVNEYGVQQTLRKYKLL